MILGRNIFLGRGPRAAQAAPSPRAVERRQRNVLVLTMLLFALVLWGVLAVRQPTNPGIRPGQPSPVSIQARRSVSYVSEWRTQREQARAESAPSTVVYARDLALLTQQRAQLDDMLVAITQIRDDPTLREAQRIERLASLPNSTLVISPALAAQIAELDAQIWEEVRQQSLRLYDRAVSDNNYALSEEAVAQLRSSSLPYWASLSAQGTARDLIVLFSGAFLRSNLTIDEEATRIRKEEARASVSPVTVQILEGESIVRAGDVVTPDIQEKLEALGEINLEIDWMAVGGKGILALLAAAVFGVYLAVGQRAVWMETRTLLTVVGLCALTAAIARLMAQVGPLWLYVFPLPMTALLLAALFDDGLALVASALLAVIALLLGDGALELGVGLLLGSWAGAFSVGRAERTLPFLVAGVAIGAVMGLTYVGFALVDTRGALLTEALLLSPRGLLNGALSAILALGLYNVVGHIAGVVTPLQLMELAHPAQPLLRKLIREAPGTYYHSVAVGNLAESAAEAIGADALLLRVASYYHDIGKTARPYFFTDNQSDRENVHNDLDPHTSAGIIADHVREGVAMARAAGLPRQIIDFIPTHHGTSVIQHFYQLARQQQDAVKIEDYSYPGPRPRSREQAILLLADSVEATVRAKVQHGKIVSSREERDASGQREGQTIDELVTSIIEDRIRSGQLDESQLTLHDIAQIRQAFVTTLQGIYHPRVEYTPQVVKT